jgi:hypothetical protein
MGPKVLAKERVGKTTLRTVFDDNYLGQPRKRAIQDRTNIGRTKAYALFIDGLYQAVRDTKDQMKG